MALSDTFFPIQFLKKFLGIPLPYPHFVQIEITNICNLKCKMCIRNFIDLEIKHMDFEVYKKVIDKLSGIKTVTLTGYGEPFTYPHIFEAINYSQKKGIKTQLTSNGLLLNKDDTIRKIIESGLSSISFSLESINEVNEVGHPNLDTLDNIKRFIALKKKLRTKLPTVTLQTLLIKGKENDLYDVIKWSADHGVERINVVRFDLNTLSEVERPTVREEKIIFKKLAELRKKHSLRIDCVQDQFFTGWQGFFYKHGKYLLGLDRNCIRLLDFSYVNVNGHVRPCCALVNHPMGNLLGEELKQIWSNKKYRNFRKTFYNVPWCRKCDAFTLKQKR